MQIKFKGQSYSKADLDNIATDKLIELYNVIQTELGGKVIKTIHTRMKFIPRVWGALEAVHTAAEDGPTTQQERIAERVEAIKKATPAPAPKAEKKAKEPSAKKGRKAKFSDEQVIKVLTKENPKRQNTRAHAKYALLKTGMTVRQYLDQEGKHPDLDEELGWARTELRWCTKVGFIKIK